MEAGRTGEGDVKPVEQVPSSNDEPTADEIDDSEIDLGTLNKRFQTAEELTEYYSDAIDQLAETKSGKALAENLPPGMGLQDLIESDLSDADVDELSYVAGLAQKAGMSSATVGTLVHRIAELRTLHFHSDEVLDGTRYAEQPVQLDDGESHGEIDNIIVRGDNYYIRDYKPVNLAKFEETSEGQQWANVMTERLGADFRDQIADGRNPFVQDMPKDVRESLRSFLEEKNNEHKVQLSGYRDAFTAARPDVNPDNVHVNVRPYFVYR